MLLDAVLLGIVGFALSGTYHEYIPHLNTVSFAQHSFPTPNAGEASNTGIAPVA